MGISIPLKKGKTHMCQIRFLLSLTGLIMLGSTPLFGQFIEEQDGERFQNPGFKRPSTDNPDLAKATKRIVEQTNEFRKKHDREPVQVNPKLTETAQYFADYMAKNDRYGHTADGNRPADRAKKFDYDYCIVLENIAYQYSSLGFKTEELAEKFTQGWIDSPGHRKNMLDPDVTDIGVAIAHSEESGNYYAVQMFGRPKSKQFEFEITNQTPTTVQYSVGDRTFPLPPRMTRTHFRCRPSEVTFQLPSEKEKTITVRPNSADAFAVVSENGRFEIRKK